MGQITREQIIGLLQILSVLPSPETKQGRGVSRRIEEVITALREVEPVAAQVRYRRPEKGLSSWSAWQPSMVDETKPKYHFDEQGWEVEYRLLYTVPQPEQQVEQCCTPSEGDLRMIDSGDFSPQELWGGFRPSCPKCAGDPPAAPDVAKLAEALEEALHYVIISPVPVRGDFIQEIESDLANYRNQEGEK